MNPGSAQPVAEKSNLTVSDVYRSSRFSIAPMLDWTDRHCRYFHRLLTKQAQLYTEMVTTGAILHGKGDYLLFNEQEQPVVLQLGGSNPSELASCAQIAQQRGYQELNLNVGCPSDRVQNGRFGACLMAEPQLVADCVKAMQDSASIPVTVKTRIGIDNQDSYAFLIDFIQTVADTSQCQDFIVHARKAWLQGLSPKENREIPELDYERVYQLKRDFPQLNISINGGITTLSQTQAQLEYVDGVMMGRAAYQNPYLLADVDRQIFADHSKAPVSREHVVEQMIPYIEAHLAQGGRVQHITRHMLGLYQGVPGARRWRRHLSENAHRPDAGVNVLVDAMKLLG
ncbi:tRNA dihydrouridine(20/20a) synthase DusA [Celerinatantimonas sp. MCCC 1A17872]|uniref:tRNA dihydrouridine(20/20a) synthase DusA n=1 Tax=Celerinatantimonas sp. MCCC 1A17872 TaxID=3177514 RepID=UPI0038C25A7B